MVQRVLCWVCALRVRKGSLGNSLQGEASHLGASPENTAFRIGDEQRERVERAGRCP